MRAAIVLSILLIFTTIEVLILTTVSKSYTIDIAKRNTIDIVPIVSMISNYVSVVLTIVVL